MYRSTRKKIERIQEIVAHNYEPGRHDRCKKWVYRNIVKKEMEISESTFFRLSNIDLDEPEVIKKDPNQLTLF